MHIVSDPARKLKPVPDEGIEVLILFFDIYNK